MNKISGENYIVALILKKEKTLQSFCEGFSKLMNNSVYGKAREYFRNRLDVRLATNSKDYQNLVKKQVLFLKRYSIKM